MTIISKEDLSKCNIQHIIDLIDKANKEMESHKNHVRKSALTRFLKTCEEVITEKLNDPNFDGKLKVIIDSIYWNFEGLLVLMSAMIDRDMLPSEKTNNLLKELSKELKFYAKKFPNLVNKVNQKLK